MIYLGAKAAVSAVSCVEVLGRSGELKDVAEAVRTMETEVSDLAEALRPYVPTVREEVLATALRSADGVPRHEG